MEFFFDFFNKTAVIVTTFIITFMYIYLKYKFSYWSRRGVAFLTPTIPFGNIIDVILMRKSASEMIQVIHMNLKQAGNKFGGLYVFIIPNFLAIDLDLIKLITTSEFESFPDRDSFIFEEVDPLTVHLFSLAGLRWRHVRNKLSPSFTPAKTKMIYQLLVSCNEQLKQTIEECTKNAEPVDIKDIVTRYTTDVIGTVAFGLDTNSLKDPASEFSKHCKLVYESDFFQNIRNMCIVAAPNLLKLFNISYTTVKVRNYFLDIIKQTVDFRETNNIDRKDFLNVLIELKNSESNDDKTESKKSKIFTDINTYSDTKGKVNSEFSFSFTDLAANAFMFIAAAMETSSSTIAFCFYELCCNSEIQSKVRKEIRETIEKYNGILTYEALVKMEYLEKVIKETLRKYPIIAFLSRKCVQEYHIPHSSVIIEKGTPLMISILAIHRDPEYYPDPMKFDPERFNEENIRTRPAFAYMPFGVGPRYCIGKHFGLTQIKAAVASIIMKYKLTLDEKTNVPLIMNPTLPLLSSKSKIWMHIEKADE